jgi:hypothetical protein
VNARRTPKRVLFAHSPDQHAQLLADRRPASQRARVPAPVAAKPGTVPRTNVSGLTISIALRSTGTSDKAGLRTGGHVAGWTRPRTFPCRTLGCCLSAAFSASSRLLDLTSVASRLRARTVSTIIITNSMRTRFSGTHRIAALKFGPYKRRLATTDNWLETVRWLTLSTIKS